MEDVALVSDDEAFDGCRSIIRTSRPSTVPHEGERVVITSLIAVEADASATRSRYACCSAATSTARASR
jgi:hypothetical protein